MGRFRRGRRVVALGAGVLGRMRTTTRGGLSTVNNRTHCRRLGTVRTGCGTLRMRFFSSRRRTPRVSPTLMRRLRTVDGIGGALGGVRSTRRGHIRVHGRLRDLNCSFSGCNVPGPSMTNVRVTAPMFSNTRRGSMFRALTVTNHPSSNGAILCSNHANRPVSGHIAINCICVLGLRRLISSGVRTHSANPCSLIARRPLNNGTRFNNRHFKRVRI